MASLENKTKIANISNYPQLIGIWPGQYIWLYAVLQYVYCICKKGAREGFSINQQYWPFFNVPLQGGRPQ